MLPGRGMKPRGGIVSSCKTAGKTADWIAGMALVQQTVPVLECAMSQELR